MKQNSPKKIEKGSRKKPGDRQLPAYARLIRDLQVKLGFKGDQEGFANHIRRGLAQGTLSAWARGLRRPSAEMFWRIGNIAEDPKDAIEFYKQGGLTEEGILRAAEKIWSDKFEPPRAGEIVRVGPLPESEDVGEIPVSTEIVPDPKHVGYFVLDEESARYLLLPGVAIIDTTERGKKLLPFWNQIVLASVETAHYIGYLLLRPDPRIGDELQREYSRFAFLAESRYGGADYLQVGQWTSPMLADENYQQKIRALDDTKELELHLETERSSRHMEALGDVEIIGRMIGYQRRLSARDGSR